MVWKTFLAGSAAGALVVAGAGVGMAKLKPPPKIAPDETIAFSDKIFTDSASTSAIGDGVVTFTGTIVGEHIGYRNNTLTVRCVAAERRCVVGSASQIGDDQVDEIELDDWEITEWSPSLIVAKYEGLCATSTMNIDRRSQHVGYVVEPTNQSSPLCNKSDGQVRKWEVGRSLFWSRNDPENAKHVR